MVKASFKTGYMQRELVMDVQVAADMVVGTVVSLSGTGNSAKITAVADSTAPANTHYIVAQSDMTMNRRNFNSEVYEYEYIDKVAASATLKKVALFKVIDPSDVVYTNV